jgi:nucleotide-binding universal stress UspA family protein
MARVTSVLCALDASSLAPRVLRHAVGVAGTFGARLTIMMVTHGDTHKAHAALGRLVQDLGPAAGHVADVSMRVVKLALGAPADVVLDAARNDVDLLVVGTHAKTGLSRWFLGSTSAAILAETPCPTLLVPPGDVDLVTLDQAGARLATDAVLAAVDLAEHNRAQLDVASEFAARAGARLLVMTVGADGADPLEVERALAARAEGLLPAAASQLIVRWGEVVNAIDHAAVQAHAGLVVMGLRDEGVRGEVATAVLTTKDAIVLAVPPPARG